MKSKKAFIASALIDFYAYVVFVLVILIFFVLFSLMKGCDQTPSMSDIPVEKSDVDANQMLMTWLQKPVSPKEDLTFLERRIEIKQRIANFSDGTKTKRFNFSINNEHKVRITIPSEGEALITKLDLFPAPPLENVLAIDGSYDSVSDYLYKKGIFAKKVGNIDDIDISKNSALFVGCPKGDELNGTKLLDWVEKGGFLFTSDWSIKLVERLFGHISRSHGNNIEGVYEIVYTGKSKEELNITTGKKINAVFEEKSYCVEKNHEDVEILAEYGDKTTCAGDVIFTFDYGAGKVIHSVAHLNFNLDILKDLGFLKKHIIMSNTSNISLDFGDDGTIDLAYGGDVSEIKHINFLDELNNFVQTTCTTFPCTFTITIKGKTGFLTLSNLEIIYGKFKKETITQGKLKDINIADLIAYSPDDADLRKLRDTEINSFFNKTYHNWWHLNIYYPDGSKKEYGHSYDAELTKKRIPSTLTSLLPGPYYLLAYSILPETEKITITQSIPSLDKRPIIIEFSSWAIFLSPHIPFLT